MVKALTVLTLVLQAEMALAKSQTSALDRIGSYVAQKVSHAAEVLAEPGWDAKHFYLTIAPQAEFEVPEVAEIRVTPQITVVWEKDEGESEGEGKR